MKLTNRRSKRRSAGGGSFVAASAEAGSAPESTSTAGKKSRSFALTFSSKGADGGLTVQVDDASVSTMGSRSILSRRKVRGLGSRLGVGRRRLVSKAGGVAGRKELEERGDREDSSAAAGCGDGREQPQPRLEKLDEAESTLQSKGTAEKPDESARPEVQKLDESAQPAAECNEEPSGDGSRKNSPQAAASCTIGSGKKKLVEDDDEEEARTPAPAEPAQTEDAAEGTWGRAAADATALFSRVGAQVRGQAASFRESPDLQKIVASLYQCVSPLGDADDDRSATSAPLSLAGTSLGGGLGGRGLANDGGDDDRSAYISDAPSWPMTRAEARKVDAAEMQEAVARAVKQARKKATSELEEERTRSAERARAKAAKSLARAGEEVERARARLERVAGRLDGGSGLEKASTAARIEDLADGLKVAEAVQGAASLALKATEEARWDEGRAEATIDAFAKELDEAKAEMETDARHRNDSLLEQLGRLELRVIQAKEGGREFAEARERLASTANEVERRAGNFVAAKGDKVREAEAAMESEGCKKKRYRLGPRKKAKDKSSSNVEDRRKEIDEAKDDVENQSKDLEEVRRAFEAANERSAALKERTAHLTEEGYAARAMRRILQETRAEAERELERTKDAAAADLERAQRRAARDLELAKERAGKDLERLERQRLAEVARAKDLELAKERADKDLERLERQRLAEVARAKAAAEVELRQQRERAEGELRRAKKLADFQMELTKQLAEKEADRAKEEGETRATELMLIIAGERSTKRGELEKMKERIALAKKKMEEERRSLSRRLAEDGERERELRKRIELLKGEVEKGKRQRSSVMSSLGEEEREVGGGEVPAEGNEVNIKERSVVEAVIADLEVDLHISASGTTEAKMEEPEGPQDSAAENPGEQPSEAEEDDASASGKSGTSKGSAAPSSNAGSWYQRLLSSKDVPASPSASASSSTNKSKKSWFQNFRPQDAGSVSASPSGFSAAGSTVSEEAQPESVSLSGSRSVGTSVGTSDGEESAPAGEYPDIGVSTKDSVSLSQFELQSNQTSTSQAYDSALSQTQSKTTASSGSRSERSFLSAVVSGGSSAASASTPVSADSVNDADANFILDALEAADTSSEGEIEHVQTNNSAESIVLTSLSEWLPLPKSTSE